MDQRSWVRRETSAAAHSGSGGVEDWLGREGEGRRERRKWMGWGVWVGRKGGAERTAIPWRRCRRFEGKNSQRNDRKRTEGRGGKEGGKGRGRGKEGTYIPTTRRLERQVGLVPFECEWGGWEEVCGGRPGFGHGVEELVVERKAKVRVGREKGGQGGRGGRGTNVSCVDVPGYPGVL